MGLKWIIFALALKCIDCFLTNEELVVHFKQFKPCDGVTDPTLKYETLGVNHVKKDTYEMYGNVVSEKELDGKLKFFFVVDKCGEDGSSSTCERAMTYKVDDVCNDIKKPSSMVKSFLEDTGIPPHCPILPGNYSLIPKKVSLDETTKTIVRSGSYWKIQSKILRMDKTEKIEFCFTCEGKVDVKKDSESNRQRKFKGK